MHPLSHRRRLRRAEKCTSLSPWLGVDKELVIDLQRWVTDEYKNKVGWSKLTVSNPILKAPMMSALETIIS